MRDRGREIPERLGPGQLPVFQYRSGSSVLYVDRNHELRKWTVQELRPTDPPDTGLYVALFVEGVTPEREEFLIEALWCEMPDLFEIRRIFPFDNSPSYADVRALFAVRDPPV